MPKRMIRDWTASETVDQLSPGAEIFFTRLIMKVDDYGNYTGNIKLINAALFPLKGYSVDQVSMWFKECEVAGLILSYEVDKKPLIHIKNFNQKLRRMRAEYPPPPDGQVTDNVRTSDGQKTAEVEEKKKKKEVEDEEEAKNQDVSIWPSFENFWDKYAKKVDRPKCENLWKKIPQGAREKIMEHLELYVRSTPEVQYRKDPATYLRNQSWENEIILKQNAKSANITRDERNDFLRKRAGLT